MSEIFDRIDSERRRNKLSVDEFMAILGYKSRCTYYDVWRENPENIKVEVIIKMAEIFGVSTDYLLGITAS